MTILEQIAAARRVSTPLIAVISPDPAATKDQIMRMTNGAPALSWDVVHGLTAINDAGEKALATLTSDPGMTRDPVEALMLAQKLPEESMLFFRQAQRFIGATDVAHAIWILRDEYKQNFRTLFLLAPELTLPSELQHDVLVLDEPLPTEAQLAEIVRQQYGNAGLELPPDFVIDRAVEALAGLASFPAEQVTAMSLTKDGITLAELWNRKRQLIDATPGLSVWKGVESFDDIGGIEQVKRYLHMIAKGRNRPRAVIFQDELEKQMSGAQGDTSGVSQRMHGKLLSYMQDHQASGLLFLGPPGSGKSLAAKAAGNLMGIPTIAVDLGNVMNSLVGASEGRMDALLKVVTAVSQDHALFVATSNNLSAVSPELRRRFRKGTFFFDLLSREERQIVWALYKRKYDLNDAVPQDEGWTGSEIASCCEHAWEFGCTLIEASAFIVPVSVSAAAQIQQLREQASGRFLSASAPGVYRLETSKPDQPSSRQIKL